MLSRILSSSYGHREHDTAIVSSRLVYTAKENGHAVSLMDIARTKPSRLKGKARKQMKEQLARVGKHTGDGVKKVAGHKHTYKYVLPMADLVSLAELVAAVTKPKPVDMSSSISSTINRAIGARKSFATPLRKENIKSDEDSDSKHSHRFGVTELLRGAAQSQTGLSGFSGGQGENSQEFSNTLASLEAYNTPNGQNVSDEGPRITDNGPNEQDTSEYAYLAFCTLIQDAHVLRECIFKLWNAYKDGKLQLSPVAMATNTAIQLIRHLEEDMSDLVNSHGGFGHFCEIFYRTACAVVHEDPCKQLQDGDDINTDTYEQADFCMVIAWKCLDALSRFRTTEEFRVYDGTFGDFDPTLNRAEFSNAQKYQQDKAALMEALADISVAMTFKSPCEDAFIHGVRHVLTQPSVPFWVIFAAQVYLDTLHVLQGPDGHYLHPFEEMQAIGKNVSDSMLDAMKYHREKNLRAKTWRGRNDASLKQTVAFCELWANDPIKVFKQQHGYSSKPNALFHSHFLYCGLWVHHVSSVFHEHGIALTQAWGGTELMGQLYHAMKRNGDLEASSWADMETLMRAQSIEKLFVDGLPETFEDDFSNFCQCLGYKTDSWVPPKHKKTGRGVVAAIVPRVFNQQAPVSTRFNQLLGRDMAGGMAAMDIKRILDESEWNQTYEDGILIVDKDFFSDDEDHGDGEAGSRRMTLVELMSMLVTALQAEKIEMSFDYFSLHVSCWTMFEAIHGALDAKMRTLFTTTYIDDLSKVPSVVGYIFLAAAQKQTWPGEEPLGLMRLAAPPMKTAIDEQGDKICTQLQKLGMVVEFEDESAEEDDEDEDLDDYEDDESLDDDEDESDEEECGE